MILLVFAKAPVIGGAKTRLARGVGKVEALRRHRAMSAQILRRLQDPRWTTLIATSPERALFRRFSAWPQGLGRVAQGSGDLGKRQGRLLGALRGPAAVVGTDSPDMRRADIAAAFRMLGRSDAVIGPAADGGYWLLALRAPAPAGLFDGVRWSHPETRADLEARLGACGLTRIAHLRTLRDIDTADDLAALRTGGRT